MNPSLVWASVLAPLLVTLLHLSCALAVTVHALLNKRHVHTAIDWTFSTGEALQGSPWFVPNVKITALRGVAVDIVLPAQSNLPLMDWAMRLQCGELVASGCRVHLSGPDFDHTKLFVVDDAWSLTGSTNWDARSLRLNFEYNLECHDAELVRQLDVLMDQRTALPTLNLRVNPCRDACVTAWSGCSRRICEADARSSVYAIQ